MIRLLLCGLFALMGFAQSAHAQNREALCAVLPDAGAQKAATCAGAEYVPGVDVHGRSVAPADLNAQPGSFDGVVRFPVTVELVKKLHITLPGDVQTCVTLGTVDIHKDGHVTINGADRTKDVYAMCGKKAPVQSIEPAAGKVQEKAVTAPVPVVPQDPDKDEIIWDQGY